MVYSILILEDEQAFINKMEGVIKSLDVECKVISAYTVEEALEKAASASIDVFLVDINLNQMRTGIDFMKEIRVTHPISPIIVVSSLAELHYKIQVFNELKVLGYIDKPFNNDALVSDLLKAFEISKIVNTRTVTFKRQNLTRTYLTKNIYCIQRMPNGKKKIVVTAADELTPTITNDEFSIKSSLTEVLDFFENEGDIIRCHQSWLVNPKFIRGFDVSKEELVLINNIKIPLGDTYKRNVAAFI